MDDKVVVITGASSGIGAATAVRLAARGMSVVLVARRRAELEQVADRCEDRAFLIVADVSDRLSVRRIAQEAIDRFGRVDVWINNVGRGISCLPSELTDADVEEMVRDNVMTALYGMQEILAHFRQRGTGHIINVSSLLGRVPFATVRSAYSGAKHFLNALTAMFRAELQQSDPGIQVSLVSPGVVRTDFGLNALHGGADSRAFPNSQSPEEVAEVISDVIDSRQADVYTLEGARERVAGYYAEIGVDPE